MSDQTLKEQLRSYMPEVGLFPIDKVPRKPPELTGRRSGTSRPPTSGVELLSLTQGADGVLRWEVGIPTIQAVVGGRRAGTIVPQSKVVEQFAFEKIEPNKVGGVLDSLDQKLTPHRGIRRWNPSTESLEVFDSSQLAGKRILLFIHGTFSNCDNLFLDIVKCPNRQGKDLLNAALENGRYDFVLTFDHPTVGVSPVMNAFDLATNLRALPREIDIVAHSRGGLVARWFLEGFIGSSVTRRAVLVATTIAGTSLASPARLKSGLNHLTNVGYLLGNVTSMVPHPFVVASGALLSIVSSVVKIGANTPILDAAVAMIPGLQGQSRVGNNSELTRLRSSHQPGQIAYFAVCSDFQPKDPGWNFLQYFSKPMQRVGYWAAELVFEGTNDLVVDVDSMNNLSNTEFISPEEVLDFGVSETVHHANYFTQERTLAFIRLKLGF